MAPRKSRCFVAAGLFGLASALAGAGMAEGPLPSVEARDLGQGRYAYMHMLFQKTILRINVATIEVRVDKPAEARLAALAQGQKYSDALAQRLAGVAIGAQRAVVEMKFKRDVGLSRWIGVVRDNLEEARQAGLISSDLERRVGQGLPQWFAPLKERGYLKGDRLIYAVEPDSLRTVVVSMAGQVFVDRMEKEEGTRKVVLASYFAPGSEFRDPLLKSLFEGNR